MKTTNGMFMCSLCGRRYKFKGNLTKHQRYECGKEPQFGCPYCPYKAKVRCNLQAHVNVRHLSKIVN